MIGKSRNHQQVGRLANTSEALSQNLHRVNNSLHHTQANDYTPSLARTPLKPTSGLLNHQNNSKNTLPATSLGTYLDPASSNSKVLNFEKRGGSVSNIGKYSALQKYGTVGDRDLLQTDRLNQSPDDQKYSGLVNRDRGLGSQIVSGNHNKMLDLNKFQHGKITIQNPDNLKQTPLSQHKSLQAFSNQPTNSLTKKFQLPQINSLTQESKRNSAIGIGSSTRNHNFNSHKQSKLEEPGFQKVSLKPSTNVQKLLQRKHSSKHNSLVRMPTEHNKIIKPKTYENILGEKVRQFGTAAIIQQLSAAVANQQMQAEYTGTKKGYLKLKSDREASLQKQQAQKDRDDQGKHHQDSNGQEKQLEEDQVNEDDRNKGRSQQVMHVIENEVKNISRLLANQTMNTNSPVRAPKAQNGQQTSKKVQQNQRPAWEDAYQHIFKKGNSNDIYQTLNLHGNDGALEDKHHKINSQRNRSKKKQGQSTKVVIRPDLGEYISNDPTLQKYVLGPNRQLDESQQKMDYELKSGKNFQYQNLDGKFDSTMQNNVKRVIPSLKIPILTNSAKTNQLIGQFGQQQSQHHQELSTPLYFNDITQKKSSFDPDRSMQYMENFSQDIGSNAQKKTEQKETTKTVSGQVVTKSSPETSPQHQDSIMQRNIQHEEAIKKVQRQLLFEQTRGESQSFQNKLESQKLVAQNEVRQRKSILIEPQSLERLAHQYNIAKLQNQGINLSFRQHKEPLNSSKKLSPEIKITRDKILEQQAIPEAFIEYMTPAQLKETNDTQLQRQSYQQKSQKQLQSSSDRQKYLSSDQQKYSGPHSSNQQNYLTRNSSMNMVNQKQVNLKTPKKINNSQYKNRSHNRSSTSNQANQQQQTLQVPDMKSDPQEEEFQTTDYIKEQKPWRINTKLYKKKKKSKSNKQSPTESPSKSARNFDSKLLSSAEIQDIFEPTDGFDDGFKSLSQFTKGYNEQSQEMIARLDEKLNPQLFSDESISPHYNYDMMMARRTNTNLKILKQTSMQMKQIMLQAKQLVCKRDEFHKVIPLDKRKEEANSSIPLYSQKDRLVVHTFDLCKQCTMYFKIKVRGEPSPLKLRFEYFDVNTQECLQQAQLQQFRSFLNIFVSKSTDNPQNVTNQIMDNSNNCEKFYVNQVPPQNITISSNVQNVPGVPFITDYVYLTIFIGDLDRLDDMQITVRATSSSFTQKGAKKDKNQKKHQNEEKDDYWRDDDSLHEYYTEQKHSNNKKARNQRHNLLTFKKEVEKKLDLLMNDKFEWEEYKEEMKERIKRRYFSHLQGSAQGSPQSPLNSGRAIFLTQEEDFTDYDLDMLQLKLYLQSSTEEQANLEMLIQRIQTQKLYELQKKCESEGNFISLNKIQIKSGQHDQIAKLRKQIGLSLINNRKQQITQRNEDNQSEHRKRMIFLQHRKDILGQIRDQAKSEAYLRREQHFRARNWIKLIKLRQIWKFAYDNYSSNKAKIDYHNWKIKCISKIRKRFQATISRWGKDPMNRQRYQIRFAFTFVGRQLYHLATKKTYNSTTAFNKFENQQNDSNALLIRQQSNIYSKLSKSCDIIEDFLRLRTQEEFSKEKFRQFYQAVTRMKEKNRRAKKVERARRTGLYRAALFQKTLVLAELFKQNAKQQKAIKQQQQQVQPNQNVPEAQQLEDTIQKYMNLNEEQSFKPLVAQWYFSRQLRSRIVDWYGIIGIFTQRIAKITLYLKNLDETNPSGSQSSRTDKQSEANRDGNNQLNEIEQEDMSQADQNQNLDVNPNQIDQNIQDKNGLPLDQNVDQESHKQLNSTEIEEESTGFEEFEGIEPEDLKKEILKLEAKVQNYTTNLPVLMLRYEAKLLQLGIMSTAVLKFKGLASNKSSELKRKQKTLKKVEEFLPLEIQAEKIDIPELSEMKNSNCYTRPQYLSWAATATQVRQIIAKAVQNEEEQLKEQEEALQKEKEAQEWVQDLKNKGQEAVQVAQKQQK